MMVLQQMSVAGFVAGRTVNRARKLSSINHRADTFTSLHPFREVSKRGQNHSIMALVSARAVLVGGAVGGAVVGPHAPSPSAVALQKEIDESIGRGSVSVAAGDYYFGDASLVIHNARNFTLRAESGPGTVQFWFAIGAGLLVNQSIDVVLDGLSIDYDPPAHYQGTIVQVNTSDDGDVVFARVKTDPGFLDPPAFNEAYKTGMPGVQSGPAATSAHSLP